VKRFRNKNLLHIYRISNPMDDPDGVVENQRKVFKMIMSESKPPYRIVGVLIPKTDTMEEIEASITTECVAQDMLESFPGSLMCNRSIEKMDPSKHSEWMKTLLQNHHAAIFVPRFGSGIGFNMR
jgi:hypothetical protein